MPGRGRPTFNKRQREQKRAEKQQEKAARREQRKLTATHLPSEESLAAEIESSAQLRELDSEDEES
jgi:hypothetical protein